MGLSSQLSICVLIGCKINPAISLVHVRAGSAVAGAGGGVGFVVGAGSRGDMV